MTILKRILWVYYIVLFIHLSSSYFIKVQAKSKMKEVDTFIQKLLDSEKFDELADKIAMKAVQRINIYNNKVAQEQLRSGIALDDTHRSAPIKKKTEDTINNQKLLSTQDLTSEEKKTTIISLKYKGFTRNIVEEDTGKSKSTTKDDENEEQLTNKEDTSGRKRTTEKVNNNEKSETNEKTSNAIKTKAKNSDHSNEFTQLKMTANTKKLTTRNNSIVAREKETTPTKKTIKHNADDDDIVDEFVTIKETIGNKKTTEILDGEEEENYLNKFSVDGKKQIPLKNDYDDDNDDKADKNIRDKKKNYEYDSDDEVVLRGNPRKSKNNSKKGETSFSPDDDVRNRHRNKNRHKEETKDLKSNENRGHFDGNSSRHKNEQDEKAVYKDTGDADPEDEKDNSDSTEERLSNNKILVRREGNTLYAQNLDEYEDYRAQLVDSGKRSS